MSSRYLPLPYPLPLEVHLRCCVELSANVRSIVRFVAVVEVSPAPKVLGAEDFDETRTKGHWVQAVPCNICDIVRNDPKQERNQFLGVAAPRPWQHANILHRRGLKRHPVCKLACRSVSAADE